MSTTPRKPTSREEFLEWAEGQDERYQFNGEQPVLMKGSLLGHDRLQFRLKSMIHAPLSSRTFEVGDHIRECRRPASECVTQMSLSHAAFDRPAVAVFHKDAANQWTPKVLTVEDCLSLPEVGIELPLAELFG